MRNLACSKKYSVFQCLIYFVNLTILIACTTSYQPIPIVDSGYDVSQTPTLGTVVDEPYDAGMYPTDCPPSCPVNNPPKNKHR